MDCSPPSSSVHGISRQEYWNGLPFPPPGNFLKSGIEPESLMCPALAGRFFTLSTTSFNYYNNPRHIVMAVLILYLCKWRTVGVSHWVTCQASEWERQDSNPSGPNPLLITTPESPFYRWGTWGSGKGVLWKVHKKEVAELWFDSLPPESVRFNFDPIISNSEKNSTWNSIPGRSQPSLKASVFISSSQKMAGKWHGKWLEFETGGQALLFASRLWTSFFSCLLSERTGPRPHLWAEMWLDNGIPTVRMYSYFEIRLFKAGIFQPRCYWHFWAG